MLIQDGAEIVAVADALYCYVIIHEMMFLKVVLLDTSGNLGTSLPRRDWFEDLGRRKPYQSKLALKQRLPKRVHLSPCGKLVLRYALISYNNKLTITA